MGEMTLKKKYRTGQHFSKGGAYRTRTGSAKQKLSKAKRAALGRGEKKDARP